MTPLGPLFRFELTRLARRGLQPRLRAAFAVLLLVALLFTYLQVFPGISPLHILFDLDVSLPIDEASRFGERFLVAFLVVQLAVVSIATPAVAGGAMIEEKERGSLDFLLSSPLTSREIVFGKMAARLVFLGGVVLTGLPILSVTMLFGGVDGPTMLAGYGITLLTMLSLGAYSLYLAVAHDALRSVLIRAYLVVLELSLFGFCCGCFVAPVFVSPFSTLFILFDGGWGLGRAMPSTPGDLVAAYATVHLPVALIYLWRATRRLREQPLAPPRGHRPPTEPDRLDALPVSPVMVYIARGPARMRSVAPLEDEDDPLEWKEDWFGASLWPSRDSAGAALLFSVLSCVAVIGFMLVVGGITSALERGESPGEVLGPAARVVFVTLVPGAMLGAGVIAVGSVARERQRQTLLPLLTLPGPRRDILRAKARAAYRAVRPLLWVMGAFLVLGVVAGGVYMLAVVVVPLVVLGWGSLAIAGGMWLSVRCLNPTRATGYFLVAFLVLCFLPALVGPLLGQVVGIFVDVASSTERVAFGLGPATGSWHALPPWPQAARYKSGDGEGLLGAALGGLLALVAASLFWRDAVLRFERLEA